MIDQTALLALLDNEALVRKYLAKFSEEMPHLLMKMQTSFVNLDWDELAMHTHTYKSQVQYIRETESEDIAVESENQCAAEEPNAEKINALLFQLQKRLDTTVEEIAQING